MIMLSENIDKFLAVSIVSLGVFYLLFFSVTLISDYMYELSYKSELRRQAEVSSSAEVIPRFKLQKYLIDNNFVELLGSSL